MFRSIGRSLELVKASYAVLRADRELIVFPIISLIGVILASIAFIAPMIIAGIVDALVSETLTSGQTILGLAVTFLYYLTTYFIVIFANTALIGAALIRLRGGDPTVADGFRIAREHAGAILGYAAISATVGMILNAIRSEDNLIGQIIASIVGVVWSLITFLVIPVLVIEGLGPIDAIKRSSALLKQTWGEQVIGDLSIGAIFGLITFALILVGILLIAVVSSLSGTLAVLLALVLFVAIIGVNMVGAALGGIFRAALYNYAANGTAGDFFDTDLVAGAFKPKRG